MFAVHFSRLVRTMGDTSSSDTNMARRCVGWASAAVTRLIWELDMADWLGSRTQPKHLCCSRSHITAGPNKMLGSRRARQEVAQAQHAPSPGKQRLCSGTRCLHSFCEICHFNGWKCCRRMHKKGKCDRPALACAHKHTRDPAGTQSAHTQL